MEENKTRVMMLAVPLLVLTGVGLGMWVFARLAMGQPAWGIFLANFLFFTGVTQGILAVAVILRVTSAKWGAYFFRMAAGAALAFFPVAAAMLLFLFMSSDSIFYWIQEPEHSLWHNRFFFMARNLLPFLAFYIIALGLAKIGTANDSGLGSRLINLINAANREFGGGSDGSGADDIDPEKAFFRQRLLGLSFLLLLFFVLYQTVMSWDLGMILNRHFADTVYAPLFIIGSVYGGAAAIVLLMAFSRLLLRSTNFKDELFTNMGQLLLGLSVFWTYAWYTQFFSIWFVNLPEETEPIYLRIFHGYGHLYIPAILLTGVLPFAMMAITRIRSTRSGVAAAAASILAGLWLDRYLIAIPPLILEKRTAPMSLINPANLAYSAGVLGIFLFLFLLRAQRTNNMIVTDESRLADEVLISEPLGWQ